MSIELHRCIHKRSMYGAPWANFELLDHFFTATVMAEHYHKFIFNFISQLNKLEWCCYFQKDEHAHSVPSTIAILIDFLRIIWFPMAGGQQEVQTWQCLFFSVVFLEKSVYFTKSAKFEGLKSEITREIQLISILTLRRVFRNLIQSAHACIKVNGSHFEHLL